MHGSNRVTGRADFLKWLWFKQSLIIGRELILGLQGNSSCTCLKAAKSCFNMGNVLPLQISLVCSVKRTWPYWNGGIGASISTMSYLEMGERISKLEMTGKPRSKHVKAIRDEIGCVNPQLMRVAGTEKGGKRIP